MSVDDLAKELSVRVVRFPPDMADVTLEMEHKTFSGHVVEVTLTLRGVPDVGLLG